MVARLSRRDWTSEGLRALAADGHQALRPERLAQRLGVSRGSFYWHFADVDAFEQAILEEWAVVAVETPYDEATASGDREAGAVLTRLTKWAFRTPDLLERAVRAWAGFSPIARGTVSLVDDRRVELLTRLMPSSTAGDAHARAVALYWTYLGHVATPQLTADDGVLAFITEMFTRDTVESR